MYRLFAPLRTKCRIIRVVYALERLSVFCIVAIKKAGTVAEGRPPISELLPHDLAQFGRDHAPATRDDELLVVRDLG